MAEHPKADGEVLGGDHMVDEVVELEEVLKRGVVVPVYKRGGKDPTKVDSYTSMISKVLQLLWGW